MSRTGTIYELIHKTAYDMAPNGIYVYHLNSRELIYCNQSFANLIGYPIEEVMHKKIDHFLISFQNTTVKPSNYESSLENEKLLHKNGQQLEIKVKKQEMIYDHQTYILVYIDKNHNKIELNQFKQLVDRSINGIAITDLKFNYTYCNHSYALLHQYFSPEEMLGKNALRHIQPDGRKNILTKQNYRLLKSGGLTITYILNTANHHKVYIKGNYFPLIDENRHPYAYAGIVEDITTKVNIEEKLKYLSYRDNMTGLYNHSYFQNQLRRLEKKRSRAVTLFVIDIDCLKLINDFLGHVQGDKAIKITAKLLRRVFRKEDIICRIGGDEFAVILEAVPKSRCIQIYKKINELVSRYTQSPKSLPLSLSIGYATTLSHKKSLENTFKEADENMYKDKKRRKSDKNFHSQFKKMLKKGLHQQEKP